MRPSFIAIAVALALLALASCILLIVRRPRQNPSLEELDIEPSGGPPTRPQDFELRFVYPAQHTVVGEAAAWVKKYYEALIFRHPTTKTLTVTINVSALEPSVYGWASGRFIMLNSLMLQNTAVPSTTDDFLQGRCSGTRDTILVSSRHTYPLNRDAEGRCLTNSARFNTCDVTGVAMVLLHEVGHVLGLICTSNLGASYCRGGLFTGPKSVEKHRELGLKDIVLETEGGPGTVDVHYHEGRSVSNSFMSGYLGHEWCNNEKHSSVGRGYASTIVSVLTLMMLVDMGYTIHADAEQYVVGTASEKEREAHFIMNQTEMRSIHRASTGEKHMTHKYGCSYL